MSTTPEQLAARIEAVLRKRESCTIFAQTIREVWSRNEYRIETDQVEAIRKFATAHGFEATVSDPSVHVIFRKKK